MNDSELHALTGAYALNALDAGEREDFERHLVTCETCSVEVTEFHATSASLGSAIAETPPAGLKARVMADIAETRQEPPRAGAVEQLGDTVVSMWRSRPQPTSRGWAQRMLAPAAAVLAIVVVGMSIVVGNLNQRIGELEVAGGNLSQVVAASDVESWQVETDGGSTATVYYSATRGEGFLVAEDMPAAPEGQAYELWLIAGDEFTPAGLFDATDEGHVRHGVTGNLSGVEALGVTVEPAGGSPQPTSDPVMVIEL